MKNIEFTALTQNNANDFNGLFSSYAKFYVASLRHEGESPYGRRFFKKKLSQKLEQAEQRPESERHIVMHSGKKLIGYASYVLSETDRFPYRYSAVCDFYIVQSLRGKGYGRLLYNYVEKALIDCGEPLVLLKADPVTGYAFWQSMGFADTQLNKARGLPLLYYKFISECRSEKDILLAFEALKSDTEMFPVNPYNKRLIKTLEPLWIAYWKSALVNAGKPAEKKRKIKKRLKNRLNFARKTPKYRFDVLYHNGVVKGFAQYGVANNYAKLGIPGDFGYIYEFGIAEEYRRNGLGTALNKHIEEFFQKHGATVFVLTPDPVTGTRFWSALGYENTGVKNESCMELYIKGENT